MPSNTSHKIQKLNTKYRNRFKSVHTLEFINNYFLQTYVPQHMALHHCLQGSRERSSLCFYSYVLTGLNYLSMCSTLLNIIHATHPAQTRMEKHHYTGLASMFLCGCAMCNSLLSLLHYFVRSDAGVDYTE